MEFLSKFKIKHRTTHILMMLLGTFLFTISRALYLERDLPPFNVTSYIPLDEFYYTIPAFNLFHYGETIHTVIPQFKESLIPTNILENTVTGISLIIFGNNYYGLRMASVFAALLIFILMFLILRQMLKDNIAAGNQFIQNNKTNGHLLLFLSLAYLLTDFSFLVAGRVAEPTIFRTLAMVSIVYISLLIFLQKDICKPWLTVFMGFAAAASVVFVYIYNLFVFCALAVSITIFAFKQDCKGALKQVFLFLVGTVLCIFVYQIVAASVYHCNLVEIYQHLVPFGNRMSIDISGTDRIVSYAANLFLIFLTNIFRFNSSLLFIFLISVPVFVWKVMTQKNNMEILILNLLIFLILQSTVINDYSMRKLIILLPLVILIIATSAQCLFPFTEALKSRSNRFGYFILYVITSFIAAIGVAVAYLNPSISSNSVSPGISGILNLVTLIIIGVAIILYLAANMHLPRLMVYILTILLFIPNLYLDYSQVFSNRTYYFRDAMIAMGQTINDKVTAGGCSYGFRLYNSSIPVLDSYIYKYPVNADQKDQYNRVFDELLSNGTASFSIAYTSEMPGTAAGTEYMTQHNMVLTRKYRLPDYMQMDIGLFELNE